MNARGCTDEAEWDEFVSRVPWATAHHGFRYGRLLSECFAYLRPAHRGVFVGGRLVAGVPLMEFSVGRIFHSLQSLPFDIYGGPLFDPAHLEDPDVHRVLASDIDGEARRIGAYESRFSIPVSAPPAARRCVEASRRTESFASDCPVLSLAPSLEVIRRNYRASVRRAVQRSAREGITVESAVAAERVRQMYPFYRARMEEVGATVKPWRFVEGVLSERIGTAFLASRGDRPVGFLILLVTPAIAIYWISAMDPAASSARPMNAMLDAAIAWAHARAIPRFSFGESHGRSGLVRYKDGWGPGPGENVVVVRTYRPGLQTAWRTLEPVARRSYAWWDRHRSSSSTFNHASVSGHSRPAVVVPSPTPRLDGRRVLVTGATGFIGQHAVRYLRTHFSGPVRVLARSGDRVRAVFGSAAGTESQAEPLEVVLGDLTDPESLAGACADVDIVIHAGSAVPYAFAGKVPAGEFERVNVRGTSALAAEALRAGVRRFVHVSSTAAMGNPNEPVVDENTPCRPTSPYQVSKHASELDLLRAHREQGLDVVIVRPCLVAGEGKRGGEFVRLFTLCRRGMFPVIGRRLAIEKPMVAVEDVVQALIRAANSAPAGEIYLIHSDGGHTLGEILEAAGRLVGNPRPYLSIPLPVARAGAHGATALAKILALPSPLTPERLDLFIASRHIDIRKAREQLGYAPEHRDVNEMLAQTYAYCVRTGQL